MPSWRQVGVLSLSLGCLGCLDEDHRPFSPLRDFRSMALFDSLPPAPLESARRVQQVQQKLVEANPDISLRPIVLTIGDPDRVEIFHRASGEILLTEGLIRQCSTEEQLAAFLCWEWAKVLAERQLQHEAIRDRRLPLSPPPLRDVSGSGNTPDQTDVAERAKLDKRPATTRPTDVVASSTIPLAEQMLVNSGYSAKALEGALHLLRTTQTGGSLERQMALPKQPPSWQR